MWCLCKKKNDETNSEVIHVEGKFKFKTEEDPIKEVTNGVSNIEQNHKYEAKDSGISGEIHEIDSRPTIDIENLRSSSISSPGNLATIAGLNEPVVEGRKEGIVSDKIKDNSSKKIIIDVFDKDDESKKLIKKAISANDFLNNVMNDERLETVAMAMKLEVAKAGNYIITECQTGSHLYVSAEGSFDVIKTEKVIHKFGPGVVFGELAILYKAKRFASIKVTTDAKYWSLERKTFQKIMMETGRLEKEENVKFLTSVSELKDLSPTLVNQLSDLLKREFHATGSRIIRQGDEGDKFYIIRGGSVTVTKLDYFNVEKNVATLKRGEFFGEQALMEKEKRSASIYANEPGTECLTLDRLAFERLLGPIEMIRNSKTDVSLDTTDALSPIKPVINPKYEHIKLKDLDVIGTLGIGGFGRVEMVRCKNESFALKSVKKIEIVEQDQIEHVYSEKDVLSSCNSPFIVKLYNTYRDSKFIYFLMEVCLGGDLFTVLQHHQYFDEKTSRFMSACVIEAFEHLHNKNVIFRDLKPENLMLNNHGYVKVVDFGFAKRLERTKKTWTFAGTPEYIAPEILLNSGHDRAVDYWELGILIHELLVGKPPFTGKDRMKMYNQILRGIENRPMHSRVPRKAQDLIKKLCRRDPTDRLGYQRNGIADIKSHNWYAGFNWEQLKQQTMIAPLIQRVRHSTDLSNFDNLGIIRDNPVDENSGWDINF